VWTDVDEFDERYETGRRLEKRGDLEAAAVEYERAIELYRGDYLIEDLYDDWTMVERERLSNAYTDMLGRLAVYYVETGEYQESIKACYRVLEKDRCHETATGCICAATPASGCGEGRSTSTGSARRSSAGSTAPHPPPRRDPSTPAS
jgi:two-component SAPR family response regulator